MPYIKQSRRDAILERVIGDAIVERKINATEIKNAGELNYAVTELVLEFFTKNTPQNYQAINDVVGALEGAKLEFNRRVTAEYEDEKIEENGDVYP